MTTRTGWLALAALAIGCAESRPSNSAPDLSSGMATDASSMRDLLAAGDGSAPDLAPAADANVMDLGAGDAAGDLAIDLAVTVDASPMPDLVVADGSPDGGPPLVDIPSLCATAVACGVTNFIAGPTGRGGMQNCVASEARVRAVSPPLIGGLDLDGLQRHGACVAAAGTDCDAARRCLNGGATAATCSAGKPTCLDGVTVLTCVSGYTQHYECTGGSACVVTANDGARCSFGNCPVVPPDTCIGGTRSQFCDTVALAQFDCAAAGETCGLGGSPDCQTGASCTGDTCQGSVLLECFGGEQGRLFDCAAGGLVCMTNAAGALDCVLGTECDEVTYAPSCNGSTLTYCRSGKIDQFDCSAAGFSGCDATGGGACKP